MRGLILVDLDNVVGQGHLVDFEPHARAALEAMRGRVEVQHCNTVFAFNTDTASLSRLSFDDLRALGSRFSEWMGASATYIELAMTLTMPEAADVILERLAEASPSVSGSGEYGFAALFSTDEELRGHVGRTYCGWKQLEYAQCRTWTRNIGNGIVARAAPDDSSPRAHLALPDADSCTIVVDTDSLAAWAATTPVDVDPGLSLKDLANAIDRKPWLLSQVGPTRTSLRGIDRMGQLPNAQAVRFGLVSRTDGLEVRGRRDRSGPLSIPETSTVGIGAVRFNHPGVTVASRLAASLLDKKKEYRLDVEGKLDFKDALRQLGRGIHLGDSVGVRLSLRDARVIRAPREPVAAWWLKRESPKSKLYLQDLGCNQLPLVGGESVDSAAVSMLSPIPGFRITLRSALERSSRVTVVSAAIYKGQIGKAVAEQAGAPAALLATRDLKQGMTVEVMPIHEMPPETWPRSIPKEFALLPIVVPAF